MTEGPEATQPPLRTSPGGANIWLISAIVLTIAFLLPVFMLMRAAAQPSARAAHAANHGFIQLDNEEGALLYQSLLFDEGRGKEVYGDLQDPPYVVGTYTPLFMATVAAADSLRPPNFGYGRVLVWCSALGISMTLVLLVAAVTRNAPVGVLAGFLFLATWEVHRWIGYFRVDFPAIFLALGGLAVVVLGNGKHLALATGALLMVMGLYTKQTVIAAPAACFAALLLHRQPASAAKFLIWMILWGLPPLLVLQLWTDNRFLRHIFSYNINTWHSFNLRTWSNHVWHMHRWFFIAGLVALPAAVILATVVAHKHRGEQREDINSIQEQPRIVFHFWQPVAWYAAFSLWNFIAISKAGSAENYLLEPIAGWAMLICLTAGGAIRAMASRGFSHWIRAAAAVAAFVIFAVVTLHAKVVTQRGSYELRFSPMVHPARPDFEAAELVRARMRQAVNPLSELAIFHLQLDQQPVLQPFIMSELARQGKWDQQSFVEDIRDAQYDVIIALDDLTRAVPTDKYTPEMLAAFYAAYKLDVVYSTPLWNYHILIPKSPEDAPTGAEIAGL